MGFQANVLNVMVASPSDVAEEREIVSREIIKWNAANSPIRRLILQPVKWETHASPEMGLHPQQIINERLLIEADIVIGIFGIRIGTATAEYISGTVEEIKRHVAAGKRAMVYFSNVPVDPNAIDQAQWAAVLAFKRECQDDGLYVEYTSHHEFQEKFGHHLAIELNRPQYRWLELPMVEVQGTEAGLSDDEKRLLIAATQDRNGQILTLTTMGGFDVQANDSNFVEDTPRSVAQWKRVLRRLQELGYVERLNESVYEVTEEGFKRAERDEGSLPLDVALSFDGPPNDQVLLVRTNRPINMMQLDFLTSAGAQISSQDLHGELTSTGRIHIDHQLVATLFNTPRADRNNYDHSGPAKVRLAFVAKNRRKEIELPVHMLPRFVQNTQWITLTGSGSFEIA
jgi:hypothetical protein